MSIFLRPQIQIAKIEDMEDTKEYLRDLNKKIRFLSQNVDQDNFTQEEYKKFYANGDKAVSLSSDVSGLEIKVKDYDTDLTARLKQTAEEILLLVSKGDVTNQINLSGEKIVISGNHLKVQSDNFTLDADGNLSMKGAIFADAGNFGGFSITGSGVSQYLSDHSGIINAADLSGTDINTGTLDISTDVDISGCSIDFTDCYVSSGKNAYFGWFYSDDVTATGTVFANCGHGETLDCSGQIKCYDCWSESEGIAYSDRALKEDIDDLDGKQALQFLMQLRPVSFEFREETGAHYGLIAQEILKTGDPFQLVEKMEDGYYGVKYGLLDAILTAAMQEQRKEMEVLGVGL